MDGLEVVRMIEVHYKGTCWRPQMVSLGDSECVRFEPYNAGLVLLMASAAGIELSKKEARSLKHLTLAKVPGFIRLKDLRNKAQAAELNGPTPEAKTLFRTDRTETKRPKRRVPKFQMDELRSNPELFTFKVDDKSVCLQRPTSPIDVIVAEASTDNLTKIIQIILGTGFTIDDLNGKRSYGSSGKPGTWKFGKYMYTTTEGRRVRAGKDDDSRAQAGEDDDMSGEQDDDDDDESLGIPDEMPEASE